MYLKHPGAELILTRVGDRLSASLGNVPFSNDVQRSRSFHTRALVGRRTIRRRPTSRIATLPRGNQRLFGEEVTHYNHFNNCEPWS